MGNVYYPDGDSQLVWIRWTTPSTPQTVAITVSSNNGQLDKITITAKIVDFNENPPPNPVADDLNGFTQVAEPSRS